MLQKLQFVKDMQCDLCGCQLSRRAKALLVGISDLVLGLAGATAVGMAVILHYMEPNPYNWSAQWGRYDHPMYLPGFAMLLGIFTVVAVLYRNDWCAIIAIILRIIYTLVWSLLALILLVTLVIVKEFRTVKFGSLMLIIVIYIITQVYFTRILLNFRSSEPTMRDETRSLSSIQQDQDNRTKVGCAYDPIMVESP